MKHATEFGLEPNTVHSSRLNRQRLSRFVCRPWREQRRQLGQRQCDRNVLVGRALQHHRCRRRKRRIIHRIDRDGDRQRHWAEQLRPDRPWLEVRHAGGERGGPEVIGCRNKGKRSVAKECQLASGHSVGIGQGLGADVFGIDPDIITIGIDNADQDAVVVGNIGRQRPVKVTRLQDAVFGHAVLALIVCGADDRWCTGQNRQRVIFDFAAEC